MHSHTTYSGLHHDQHLNVCGLSPASSFQVSSSIKEPASDCSIAFKTAKIHREPHDRKPIESV